MQYINSTYRSFLILLLLLSSSLGASHIIGGNFKIEQTGRNTFSVDLAIFRDCGIGNPATTADDPIALQPVITIRVYDGVTYAPIQFQNFTRLDSIVIQLGDECYSPPNLCVEEYHFTGTITLVDNPSGYIIAAQSCCRNFSIGNIINPQNTGVTWSAQIPDPSIKSGNSTPDLGPYPSLGFLCVHDLRSLELAAKDADGDSLVYEVITPFTGPIGSAANPNPFTLPPFQNINWLPGFSTINSIPGTPSLNIDPETGLLSCKATQLGLYVFAYRVSEYRNGIKIGEVQRDLQLEVLSCEAEFLPQIIEPTEDSYTIGPNDELCINVLAVDSNATDTLILTTGYTGIPDNYDGAPNSLTRIGFESVNGTICWQPGCLGITGNHTVQIKLKAVSKSCGQETVVEKNIDITIENPSLPIAQLIPNTFTPNGDNLNDRFTLTSDFIDPCIETFYFKIYNRWGILLYQNNGQTLDWDGTFQGVGVSQGVYFYVANGYYGNAPFEFGSHITLTR